jgi:hypothetical protein
MQKANWLYLLASLVLIYACCGQGRPPSNIDELSSTELVAGREKHSAEQSSAEVRGESADEALHHDTTEMADGGTGDVIPDHAVVWEDRAIEPLEGFDPDAGIPPDYDWGQPGHGFIQSVVSFQPKGNASHGHHNFPQDILGHPHGGGESKGSLRVVSLGCGGSIILEFSNPLIGNGPGPDFIIFENAFAIGKKTFSEPAKVSVSIDGITWHSFPCQPDKISWPHPQCAGIQPVLAHPDNDIDPHDPQTAGGDAFDLEDLGLPYARFIKIEDLSYLLPEAKIWCNTPSAGFDLDAIAVIWGYKPPK